MEQSRQVTHTISAYLERIAAELGNVSADEKDTILQEVESHIYDALRTRCGEAPSVEDLKLILAGMDSPESYCRDQAPAATITDAVAEGHRFCRYTIVAGALGALSLTGIILILALVRTVFQHVGDGQLAVAPLMFLFVLAAIASTVLGLVGISAIRASRGRLIGMPLAVAMSLLYPIIALSYALVQALYSLCVLLPPQTWRSVAAGVAWLITIAVDIFIIRAVWRWATRPVATDELM